jgi:dCTP deaminase
MLNDKQIKELVQSHNFIQNFVANDNKVKTTKHLSYGLNPVGYDVRLGSEFKIAVRSGVFADPLQPNSIEFYTLDSLVDKNNNQYFILPPQTFALGVAVETFKIPYNITGTVSNKSTLARCGLNVLTTTIKPGWHGSLTLEFFNYLQQPLKLYINQGICTIQFYKIEKPSKVYNGKYQNQKGLTSAL